MLKRIACSLALLAFVSFFSSCFYKLNQASIPPDMKTIRIDYFENNAPLVVNTLSQYFTEQLKDRIRSQTRLSIVQGEANATLTGNIIGYSIAPVSVQSTNPNTPPIASASRLTITVNVNYVNQLDKKLNFQSQFSRYADFTGDISSRQQALIQTITQQLTEDIFNKAFANW